MRICEQNEAFGNRGDMTHEQFLKECDCELFSPEQMRYTDQSLWTSVLKVNGTEGSTIVELLWDASTMSIERVMLMTESPDSFAFIHLMR